MNNVYWNIIFGVLLIYYVHGVPAATKTESRESFLDVQATEFNNYMNVKERPCNDFYEYACGNWEKYNRKYLKALPVVTSIKVMTTKHDELANQLLIKNKPSNRAEKLFQSFIASCLDLRTINKKTNSTLLTLIQNNGGWPIINQNWSKRKFDLINVLAKQATYDFSSLLNFAVVIDTENPESRIIKITAPNLCLKNQNHYLKKKKNVHLKAYKIFIQDVLHIFNVSSTKSVQFANEIVNFEIYLTNFTVEHTANAFKYSHSTTLRDMIRNYPSFDWNRYFKLIFGYELPQTQYIRITDIQFFDKFIEKLTSMDKRILANYLTWSYIYQLVNKSALVTEPFIKAYSKFLKAIHGVTLTDHRIFCMSRATEFFRSTVNAMYLKHNKLDNSTKAYVHNTFEEIRKVYYDRIEEVNWMDLQTKHAALLKLNATTADVGCSDSLLNSNFSAKFLEDLDIGTNYLENSLKLKKFQKMHVFQALNKTVNRDNWTKFVPVTDVLAQFYLNHNRIFISAGMLQPPVYHKYYPQAINYGVLGFIIGHELSHSVDYQGRYFDYAGVKRPWWTKDVYAKYEEKADCFIKFYDNFTIENFHLNGKHSLSENIADIGGISLSYAAYKKWLSTATDEELMVESVPKLNFDVDQLFFMGFSHMFCGNKVKLEFVKNVIETDIHIPHKYRLLAALQNTPEFAKAFNCPVGSPMNPINKCKLW